MLQPTVGSLVHYVLPDGISVGEHRPAIVVKIWTPTCVQLQVFTDSSNDGREYASGIVWKTSVVYDEGKQMGTWHWPEENSERAA